VSVRTPTPSVAELRAVAQPPSIFARNSGEHWAGRLYMRKVSPYVTRQALRTRLTPNAVTWLMMVVGLLAAGVLTLPGLLPAVAALLLIQVQLLLDCVDGEMARWLDKRSPVGVYLDQLAHHVTETALPIALGIRADGGWDSIDTTWTTIGLIVAVIQLLVKAETSLVHVARSQSKMAPVQDRRVVAEPRTGTLRRLRELAGHLPFYRAFVAVEASILAFAAAVVDELLGNLHGSRVLLLGLVVSGLITFVGHLASILASQRLK
jgi:phosphatidylglycerophosphate synthase